MGLPQRVFYTIHEAAARWGCMVSDIAGWANTGNLRLVTGIPPVECGETRAGGLVQFQPVDILPIFRRCGTGPQSAHLQRVRPLDETDWLYISAPADGVLVSIGDVLILGQDVQSFEDAHNLFGRIAEGAGLSEDGDYDWAAMHVEITRRVFEDGLPASQNEWIRELQDWFAARSDNGNFPDERSIRRRLKPILEALQFKRRMR
ncbi:hypothetical protein ACROSR_18490 [Roseovarius tibetensis]|uniref:hypothetical protein n=1 Tax=Roseovarius tibetensis TaxID=2685897 RepID=UPI003D7FC3C6